MSAKPSFFAELQRRNVYKVGAMYCVAGWLLVQIVTQVFPIFHVSEVAQRLIVLAIVAGFPVVLVLSWIYELTPQGIVRTDEVAPDASITRQTGQKLNRAIIAGLSVVVLVLLARLLWPHAAAVPDASTPEAAAPSDKSVAVLPFENLSSDKDNAFFAEGIQDEILTRLAKVGALKVISRTSTAHYASSPDNLPEIARRLGVANILEGSVQKSGDMVHVNVQLIRAATDAHLWAESYNRKLDDIFGVEGEVAQTIAERMNAALSGEEKQAVTAQPTQNPAAYEAYLRGRTQANRGFAYDNWLQARDSMREATRLDPQFALAWSFLADVQSYLYWNGVETGAAARTTARTAADNALRLAPELGEAYAAQGIYRYYIEHDFAGALAELQKAQARDPNNPNVVHVIALVERRLGKWDDAIRHERQSLERDPLNENHLEVLALEMLLPTGRFEEARAVADQALQIDPANSELVATKALSYQNEGRLDAAQQLLDGIPYDVENDTAFATKISQLVLTRRFAEAAAHLQQALASQAQDLPVLKPPLYVGLGQMQLRLGQAEAARLSFQSAVAGLQAMQPMPVNEYLYPLCLAQAYAGLGEREAALHAAQAALDAYRPDASNAPSARIGLAQIQAQFGDLDDALAALPDLLKAPNGLTPALLRKDPAWDPLRKDPRFEQIMAQTEHP